MIFTYSQTDIHIAPFSHISNPTYPLIIIHKPVMVDGIRQAARVTWSRFAQQYPLAAYEFSQALFVAAGLADVLNLVPDMREVKQFGLTEPI